MKLRKGRDRYKLPRDYFQFLSLVIDPRGGCGLEPQLIVMEQMHKLLQAKASKTLRGIPTFLAIDGATKELVFYPRPDHDYDANLFYCPPRRVA
jgi:hypothetical protein